VNYKDTAGDDTLVGTTGDDSFNVTHGGNDTVEGLDGDDLINFGATLTAADMIDGGAGTDRVILSGDYSSTLTLADTTMVNVEEIILRAGSSYSIATADGNVAAGQSLTIDGVALGAANTLTFNGGAETDGRLHVIGGAGSDRLIGGARSDVFDISHGGEDSIQGYLGNDVIRAGNKGLDAGDTLRGGAGNDALELTSGQNITLGPTTLLSIERVLLSGSASETLVLNAATVASAGTMTFDSSAMTGKFALDATATTSGTIDFTGSGYNDTLTFGSGFTAQDVVNGGGGADTLVLNGDYSAGLTLLNDHMTFISAINFIGGFTYDITFANAAFSTLNASAAGQMDIDISHVLGFTKITGSAGDDVVTAAQLYGTVLGSGGDDRLVLTALTTASGAHPAFDGGDGFDTIELDGDHAGFESNFRGTIIKNVEEVLCDAGHSYSMIFDTRSLTDNPNLRIDGSALGSNDTLTVGSGTHDVTGGAGNDRLSIYGGTITGGGGADVLQGGSNTSHDSDNIPTAVDQFVYNAVGDSTSTAHDTVWYFQPSQDTFKLWYQVTGIDAQIMEGSLSSTTFDSDLTAAVGSGQLAAYHAVLFTPGEGSLSGQTFLVIDANGQAGYQAGQDLVMQMMVLDNGTLTTANFTT